jgi:hypothetical protein
MSKMLLVCVGLAAAIAAGGAIFQDASGARPQRIPDEPRVTAASSQPAFAQVLAEARLATAKYATNLGRAKRDGYTIITPMMRDMGYHFLNPKITGFDAKRPAILVYVKRGSAWQLVAFEWVFPEKPKQAPLPGARYGSFGAACHYADGTFVFEQSEDACAPTSPETGARFGFWHPDLVTLHLWAWYPNPEGVYNGTNPLIRPFNHER